ncbi:serine/threonine-protein kinase [Polyangium sp. 6x1]|uniref:WD40 repeat domain-containing serine/threonine protein kinase n=1 Tax=Polyangium sp. 6x1 TaxID=3042689 RepID=UPI002482BAB5|nr:serine/threonine-protein kinase [Polyangium sp. 6x1]MDI1447001.1 protein kinase [Polyangium sp. 6x1]
MPLLNAGQHLTPTLKLLRCLGMGGMGSVWAAENLALGTQVAVKLMAPVHISNAPSTQRFRQEAQAAARIRSPYVATVFDHGMTEDGQPYIVMELLEGETLKRRLQRLGPLPPEDVLRLFGQTARGVGAAHKLGVIHRDIKPDNLFVIDDEGEPFVKVLDFGIAKQLDATSDLTATGVAMGTPPYMSPEQYDDTKRVDLRTDLWSMAVVTYEMLTGKLPFEGSTLVVLAIAIAKGEFRPPSSLRPELPRSVDAWMARALSVDVAGRFGSAMEMADALASAMKPAPERERRSSIPAGPQVSLPHADTEPEEVPRSRAPGKLLPDAIGARFEPAPRSVGKAAPAAGPDGGEELRLEIADDPERGVLSLDILGIPTWGRALSFDERGESLFVAFATGEVVCFDLARKRMRWWNRANVRADCLATGAGYVAVGYADGQIRVFDADTGTQQISLLHPTPFVRALAINPSAKALASSGHDDQVVLWSLTKGERLQVASAQGGGVRAIAFDRRLGLWATGSPADRTVRVWDASFRPMQVLRGHGSAVRSLAFAPDGSYLAAGCHDGALVLWATRRWTLEKTLRGHKKPIVSVAFLPGAGIAGSIVTGAENLRIWGIVTGKTQVMLGSGEVEVTGVAARLDGKGIASATADGRVLVHRWPIHPSLGAPSSK